MEKITSFDQIPAGINHLFERLTYLEQLIITSPLGSPAAPADAVPPDAMLTRKEAAAILRISLPTLNKLTKKGKIPGHRVPGTNSVRYLASDVTASLTGFQSSGLSAK